jgi:hypothetical protein
LKNPRFSKKNWMDSLCRARKILSRRAGIIGSRFSGAKRPLLDFWSVAVFDFCPQVKGWQLQEAKFY